MWLTEFIESTKDFKTILTTIRDQNQLITGVAGSAKTLLLAARMKADAAAADHCR